MHKGQQRQGVVEGFYGAQRAVEAGQGRCRQRGRPIEAGTGEGVSRLTEGGGGRHRWRQAVAEGFYCSQRVVEASRGRRGWSGRPVKVGASRSRPQQRGFTARKEAKPVCKQLHRWST